MAYSLYTAGDGPMGSITLDELKAENAKTGLLLARAENSGCEGCYVEVAKWNTETDRWERYAFEKYFGGEHPSEVDDDRVSCFTTAEKFAAEINNANRGGEYNSLIHAMPTYGSAAVPVVAGNAAQGVDLCA